MATEQKAKANFPPDIVNVGDNGGAGGQQPAMRIMPVCAKITLRGKLEDAAFAAAAKSALGFAPPEGVGKTTTGKTPDGISITMLCLGPDEWMLWAADDERESLLGILRQSFDGIFAAVVDVSDYYAIIRLAGEDAEQRIASGCPLDTAQLPVGNCAQTHHGAAQIVLYRTAQGFDIQTRISMTAYLQTRLQTATPPA